MPAQRILNIELLRIFSMLLIFLWHIGGHFMPYVPEDANVTKGVISYAGLFITFHVDVFVLISGFFGVRKRREAFVKTLLLCVFYALVLNIISVLTGGIFNITEVFLPLSSSPWWFLKVYFLLVLISPVIEKYIDGVSNREFYILIGSVLLLDVYFGFFLHLAPYDNHGYDIFNFILVYLLGCWLRRDDRLITSFKSKTLLPFITFLVCCAIRYKVQSITTVTWTDYNSPINLIMALSVFCLFLKLKVSECLAKPILFLSTSAVAVYLITDYNGVRDFISIPFQAGMQVTSSSAIMQFIFIVVFILVGYFLCCIIDKIRFALTKPLEHFIIKKI